MTLKCRRRNVAAASARIKAGLRGTIPASLAVSTVVQLFAAWLVTSQTSGLSGMTLGLWIAAVTTAILTPVVFIVSLLASRDTIRQLSQSLATERELRDEALRAGIRDTAHEHARDGGYRKFA